MNGLLDTYVSCLELLLLVIESSLDDRGSGQKALFQRTEGFIFDLDGRFFFQRLTIVETALFEDGQQRIIHFLLSRVILLVLLPHLHLITSLSIDGLLENPHEDVLRLLGTSLLVYSLFRFSPLRDLAQHVLLLHGDLLHAVHFKLMVLFLDLLLFGLLMVLIVHVVDIGLPNKIVSLPLFGFRCDLAFFIVEVDVDLVHGDVELGLFYLVRGWKVRVKLELLRHLVD